MILSPDDAQLHGGVISNFWAFWSLVSVAVFVPLAFYSQLNEQMYSVEMHKNN